MGFKQRGKIKVEFFDMETLEMKETEMFVEGYKAVLVKDMSFKGFLEGVVYIKGVLGEIAGAFQWDILYNINRISNS